MEDILIKTDSLPEWLVRKYWLNKDLISIEDMIATIEDISDDLEHIKELYEDLKQDVEDNYKFIDQKEAIGYDESW